MSDRTYRDQPGRLGAQLRARRQALRLTQQEVAELAGTTQRTVSTLETGKPSSRLDVLVAVSRALGLELVAVSHEQLPTLLDEDDPNR